MLFDFQNQDIERKYYNFLDVELVIGIYHESENFPNFPRKIISKAPQRRSPPENLDSLGKWEPRCDDFPEQRWLSPDLI